MAGARAVHHGIRDAAQDPVARPQGLGRVRHEAQVHDVPQLVSELGVLVLGAQWNDAGSEQDQAWPRGGCEAGAAWIRQQEHFGRHARERVANRRQRRAHLVLVERVKRPVPLVRDRRIGRARHQLVPRATGKHQPQDPVFVAAEVAQSLFGAVDLDAVGRGPASELVGARGESSGTDRAEGGAAERDESGEREPHARS